MFGLTDDRISGLYLFTYELDGLTALFCYEIGTKVA